MTTPTPKTELPDEFWLDPSDAEDLVVYTEAWRPECIRYTRTPTPPAADGGMREAQSMPDDVPDGSCKGPLIYDEGTSFWHLDDGGAPEGIRWVREDAQPEAELLAEIMEIVPATPLQPGMTRDIVADIKRLIARRGREAEPTRQGDLAKVRRLLIKTAQRTALFSGCECSNGESEPGDCWPCRMQVIGIDADEALRELDALQPVPQPCDEDVRKALESLDMIARQHLTTERDDNSGSDYEYAYDVIVTHARRVLPVFQALSRTATTQRKESK